MRDEDTRHEAAAADHELRARAPAHDDGQTSQWQLTTALAREAAGLDLRAAIQRDDAGGDAPGEPDAHRIAAEGFVGAGRSLPHLGAIQAAFGAHDVRGVEAHVGGPAAEASARLGARAYAAGERVAFAREPDLHLAAHEAAHVVQQGRGVALSGGIGRAGDVYERHADAVADRVVAGRSAVDLLDAAPTGGAGAAVQRDEDAADGGGPRLRAFLAALAAGDEGAALAAARLLSGAEPDAALARGQAAAVSTFGNASIAECARLLVRAGGRLAPALRWLFAEGTDWPLLRSVLAACPDPAQKAALDTSTWRSRFVGAVGNAEMAELVALLGFDLPTSLRWMCAEGTDAEAVLPLIRRAPMASRAGILVDPALVEALAGTLGRSEMLEGLEQIGAPLPRTLTVAMDGWACEAGVILRLVHAAGPADRAALAADEGLTTRLQGELSDVDWHGVSRLLFDAASAVGDIASMTRLFELRFGVAVGSAGDMQALAWMPGAAEVPFGVAGLTRIYHLFETLPADHVSTLEHLMAESTTSGKAAEGTASSGRSYMRIRYDETRTGDTESGAYTHPGDQMRGINVLDTTTAHELAHRVDGGGTYSKKASFLALCGWVHSPAGSGATLRSAMQGVMIDPLPAGLTARETAIAETAAEKALDGRHKSSAQFTAAIRDAYTHEGADPAGHATGAETWQPAAALDPILRGANLFQHIAAGHVDRAGWKREPFPYLPTRQFHEAYAGRGWWSYLNHARTGKLSWYQFRDPGEMFAELYATYHCTQPKGINVPLAMKAWFEAEGLHR